MGFEKLPAFKPAFHHGSSNAIVGFFPFSHVTPIDEKNIARYTQYK
jgi:hypothetical protein